MDDLILIAAFDAVQDAVMDFLFNLALRLLAQLQSARIVDGERKVLFFNQL